MCAEEWRQLFSFIHKCFHCLLAFSLALGTMTPSQEMISAARSLHFGEIGRSAVRASVRCVLPQLSKIEMTWEPRQEASVKKTGCQASLVGLRSPAHMQSFLVLTDITVSRVFCLSNSNSEVFHGKGRVMPLVKCQNDPSSSITFSILVKRQPPDRLSLHRCMQWVHL